MACRCYWSRWSSPLLSEIDVAVVGRHVGVLGLASLGPATSVCDLSMYVFNALSVSTTRLAAAALADGDETGAARNVGDGAAVAVLLGITYGAAVAFAPALFLGPFLPQAVDARALPLAVSYTRVRALGFPAALLTVVLQSAALARRIVRTPLKAVWLGALVNGIGDYVLVARCGAGVAGAAAAWRWPRMRRVGRPPPRRSSRGHYDPAAARGPRAICVVVSDTLCGAGAGTVRAALGTALRRGDGVGVRHGGACRTASSKWHLSDFPAAGRRSRSDDAGFATRSRLEQRRLVVGLVFGSRRRCGREDGRTAGPLDKRSRRFVRDDRRGSGARPY